MFDRLFAKGIVIDDQTASAAEGPTDRLRVSVARVQLLRTHATVRAPLRVLPRLVRKRRPRGRPRAR